MSLYIGVDFHPHQQTVCWCDLETGELRKRTLFHHTDEVRKFYQTMPSSIVGIEATSKATWFEDLLFENNHKLLVGNAQLIRKRAPSQHKSDDRDAEHIFTLLLAGEFPMLWQRSRESSAILENLYLRASFVRQRTQTFNRLQAIAHEVGLPKGNMSTKRFQIQLKQAENLRASSRWRSEKLFDLVETFNHHISELDNWLKERAEADPQVQLLMTQSGVGPLTSLCFVNTIGDISRFSSTRQITAFVGLDPVERSSGSRIRFGRISKAGSPVLRHLLGQSTLMVIRRDQKLKSFYKRLCKRKPKPVAKTAAARKLLVKLSIMLRDQITAQEFDRRGRLVGDARAKKGLQ